MAAGPSTPVWWRSPAAVPRPTPDFAINLAPGKQIHLTQYTGKTVVLAFILTYCTHCQKSVGFLSNLQQEYGPRGLQALASAIRGDTLYVAAPIIHDNKFVMGVVWTDTSLAPVQADLLRRWLILIAATIGALLLACAAGWWLSARIARPLAAIQVVAEKMASERNLALDRSMATAQQLLALTASNAGDHVRFEHRHHDQRIMMARDANR